MFWKRFISGAVILVLTLLFGYVGGAYLAVVLAVLSCIAYVEFTQATQVRKTGHRFNGLQTIGLISIICYYLLLLVQDKVLPIPDTVREWLNTTSGAFNYYTVLLLLIFTITVIFMLGAYIFAYPRFDNNQIANAVFGIVYVGLMLSFIYYIRNLPNGVFLVWMAFVPAWVCDTCAYFTGSLIGKHKLCPNLSPKKSIEGSVGGVIGAVIVGVLIGWLYAAQVSNSYSDIVVFAIVTFVCSICSQCGDLAASAIKRNNGVKDFGKIIPGHGGIIDRFDSVFFTAPMVYFLLALFLN